MKLLPAALCAALWLAVPLQAGAEPGYPPPPGHVNWLQRHPDLVFPGWRVWTTDMALLQRVNRRINASMTYRADERDIWGRGSDCEDFAVRKLEALLRAGVPRGALRIAVARVQGRGHAVLIAQDEWVLDNRHDEILRRDAVDFRVEAWETEDGGWSSAGAFTNLAEHLQWSRPAPLATGTAVP